MFTTSTNSDRFKNVKNTAPNQNILGLLRPKMFRFAGAFQSLYLCQTYAYLFTNVRRK